MPAHSRRDASLRCRGHRAGLYSEEPEVALVIWSDWFGRTVFPRSSLPPTWHVPYQHCLVIDSSGHTPVRTNVGAPELAGMLGRGWRLLQNLAFVCGHQDRVAP